MKKRTWERGLPTKLVTGRGNITLMWNIGYLYRPFLVGNWASSSQKVTISPFFKKSFIHLFLLGNFLVPMVSCLNDILKFLSTIYPWLCRCEQTTAKSFVTWWKYLHLAKAKHWFKYRDCTTSHFNVERYLSFCLSFYLSI